MTVQDIKSEIEKRTLEIEIIQSEIKHLQQRLDESSEFDIEYANEHLWPVQLESLHIFGPNEGGRHSGYKCLGVRDRTGITPFIFFKEKNNGL